MKNEQNQRLDIKSFADKYIEFFEKEFGHTKKSYYDFFDNNKFPNDCRALGFEMDCGKQFEDAYGSAWNSLQALKDSIDTINDVKVIGSGLFSQWRYYNHWAYPSDANDETKKWFLILLYKLKTLC